ncbi:MAG: class I SAM-dependent methyltransferase [Endomicrobium sp.]|jgi:SAM-dependent methyltransferase|nr:class I SAM-dependent methyltransferase [Endomicrobium sp.]
MDNIESLEQERPCPVCGSKKYSIFASEQIQSDQISEFSYSSRKIPEFMHLKLVSCDECGLIYAPLPTSKESLKQLYTESSFDSINEEIYAARTYLRIIKPFLKQFQQSDTVLEVGAGSGSLLSLLKKHGFSHVVGIEPSIEAIEQAEPDVINDIRQGIFNLDIVSDINPSLIISCMTLEHIYDPKEFLEAAHKIIKPDGLIVLVTHNQRALINRILGLKSPIIDLEHLQLFSPRSLTILLKNTGFTNICVKSYFNTYSLRYWLRLLPLPIKFRKSIDRIFSSNIIGRLHMSFPVGNILTVAKPIK